MISAFLPCRRGSERVADKNIKKFSKYNFGLTEIKLLQLVKTDLIDRIYLSTDDEKIINFASNLKSKKIIIHKRCSLLCQSTTSTDDLVAHAVDLIKEGVILWTHVTSPFLTCRLYDDIIKRYHIEKNLGFDSLMTVTEIQSFIWDESGPINYDRTEEKWPRTQTIKPIYEINSGVFLADCEIYKKNKDRIGDCPYLYKLDGLDGFDIDWPEDFVIAQQMCAQGLSSVGLD